MIKRLTEVLVRLVDLIEAEGVLIKLNALRFAQALVLVAVAGALTVLGVVGLMVAVYQALRLAEVPRPLASLAAGGGMLVLAGIMVGIAQQRVKHRPGLSGRRRTDDRRERRR